MLPYHIDHVALADDDLLQLLLHEAAVLAEFLENIAQAALFGGHHISLYWGSGLAMLGRQVQSAKWKMQSGK